MTATASGISLDQRNLLTNISWQTYERLLEEIGDRPIRLTYNRGTLKITSPSSQHEIIKRFIGRLIEKYCFSRRIPLRAVGSTTQRKRIREQGLEPDECYYIHNEPAVRTKLDLDFNVDPPPDLAVEVDISRSSIDRLAIYAGLGVPEIWRYDDGRVHVLQLGANGEYAEPQRSLNLPDLSIEDVNRAIDRLTEIDDDAVIREFLRRVAGDE